jgi:hypothetical protein
MIIPLSLSKFIQEVSVLFNAKYITNINDTFEYPDLLTRERPNAYFKTYSIQIETNVYQRVRKLEIGLFFII